MEEIIKIVTKYVYAESGVPVITPEHTIHALGIDSLKFLLLLIDLETSGLMGPLKPDTIGQVKTVGDLVQLCAARHSS